MEFKLYIVIQEQDIFQITKATILKYWFQGQKTTLNNRTHNMLIAINLGAFNS